MKDALGLQEVTGNTPIFAKISFVSHLINIEIYMLTINEIYLEALSDMKLESDENEIVSKVIKRN